MADKSAIIINIFKNNKEKVWSLSAIKLGL